MSDRCAECRFALRDYDPDAMCLEPSPAWICRRNPPIHFTERPTWGNTSMQRLGPVVSKDYWCGEFQRAAETKETGE